MSHLYPELLLTERGVAVNPLDVRYSHLTPGQLLINPLGRAIELLHDSAVDRSKGHGTTSVGCLSDIGTVQLVVVKYFLILR